MIIGKAGSGKSFIIDSIRNALGNKCNVASLFGVAAYNVHGKTLHYHLKLSIKGKRNNDLNGLALMQLQDNMTGVDYIIIDEYSVISLKKLAWINRSVNK